MRGKITRKRLAVFGATFAAVLAVAVPAAWAGTTLIQGSLSPGDTVQTDRLFRDGVPSTCNTFKFNPGLLGDAGLRSADAYTFWNATNQFQCVTVRLRTACGPIDPVGVNGFVVAYEGVGYNPLDPSLNWIADAGQSGQPMQFGVVVAPFETFQVVVSTVDVDLLNCNSYTLVVQIGKTARVTPNASGKFRPGAVDVRRAR